MSNLIKYKSPAEDPVDFRIKRITTSALLSILGFITANLLHKLMVVLYGRMFGYVPKVTFLKTFLYPDATMYWGKLRVAFINGMPLLTCLILAFIVLNAVTRMKKHFNVYRLYLLWVHFYLVALILFFISSATQGSADYFSPIYQGFSVIAAWFRIPKVLLTVLAFACIPVAMIWGHVLALQFMNFSYSHSLLERTSGRTYILRMLLLWPVTLTVPVLFFLSYPENPDYYMMFFAVLIFMITGAFFRTDRHGARAQVSRSDVSNRTSLDLLVIVILLVGAVKIWMKWL